MSGKLTVAKDRSGARMSSAGRHRMPLDPWFSALMLLPTAPWTLGTTLARERPVLGSIVQRDGVLQS